MERLSPFSGIDNVHYEGHVAFAPSATEGGRITALLEASNLDLTDDGRLQTRKGMVETAELDTGQGAWEINGRYLVQSKGSLKEGVTTFVTGLLRRASLVSHNGLIYGTDGTQYFEIEGTTVRNWGLPVPVLTITATPDSTSPPPATAGPIAAGTYLVQASFSDSRGNEGGACDSYVATLSNVGNIVITLGTGSTTGATHVNLYVSPVNHEHTSFVAKVALASLPYSLTSTSVTVGDPPSSRGLTAPPAGLAGLVSHRAFLMGWRDNVIWRSEAQEPHLFDPEAILPFAGTVRACESVAGGLWVATSKGLVWVAGEDPQNWIPIQRTTAAATAGSMLIEGHKLGTLQTADLVALFCTSEGLVAGLPGGSVAHLTDGRYHFDPGARASFAYCERDDLRQIFIGLIGT